MARVEAQARPSDAGLRCLVAAAAAASWGSGVASAGAWVVTAPEGQEIVHVLVDERGVGYEGYAEAPFAETAAIVSNARYGVEPGGDGADVGVKLSFGAKDGFASAIQTSALWLSSPDPGCGAWGGELRGLWGVGDASQFLNLEVAGRRLGPCDAVRVEASLGWRWDGQSLTMLQAFTNLDDPGTIRTTAQVSAVILDDDRRGFEIGLRYREGDGPALVVGLWGR